ncbi:hypothetical protein DFH06DRAFT_1352768 [Mycena polygramma]|nr:hypothetical protein DFH06DRAFT_1352768 [Mycena polygramma]
MARGRKPLDPDVKAQNRKATLQRYAEKWLTCHAQDDRGLILPQEQGRASLRAAAAESPTVKLSLKRSGLQAAARYRDRNRKTIREKDSIRRARKYIETSGLEAFDEKTERKLMGKTQRRYEGRPPPPRPRTASVQLPLRRPHRPPPLHERRLQRESGAHSAARPLQHSSPRSRRRSPPADQRPPRRHSAQQDRSSHAPRAHVSREDRGFGLAPLNPLKRRRPLSPETPSPPQQRRRFQSSPLPPSSDDLDSSDSDPRAVHDSDSESSDARSDDVRGESGRQFRTVPFIPYGNRCYLIES